MEDIAIVSAWVFLKMAVLDWSQESKRTPRISRALCAQFRASVTARSAEIAIPRGLQIWIAQYRRERTMEARAEVDELTAIGPYRGYAILVITYILGSFLFQATFPKWIGMVGKRPPMPAFEIVNDKRSERIWPFVPVAHWPPPDRVSGRTLNHFRERLRRVLIARNR